MNDKVSEIKKSYLLGMRIRLIKMGDKQAPPIGCENYQRC